MPEQQSPLTSDRVSERAAPGLVGRVLAGHRIDALVGEGGMGVVYRATHLRLGRTVALKVLPPALAADLGFRSRFEREAAIAASLEHPNVVPIYDAGHADGILYLSMRFVDGEDLGAVLRREGRLGIEGLCAILGPVADALDAVHEAGLVHRDVKPGNVLLARARPPRRGAHVYLCDFGIAKGTAYAGRDLTSADRYMGTPQYSSPEQIEGRWLDGRSDQYGLACLVYRCLTGEVPYPRPEVAGVIYAHLAADPPRPSRLRPDLPPAVDAAVARAAAKHPDHRFPTCAAFLAALRAAVRTPPPPRAPSSPRTPPPPLTPPSPGTSPLRGTPPSRPTPRPRPSLPPTLPLPEPERTLVAPSVVAAAPAVPEPVPALVTPEPAAPEAAAPEPVAAEPAAPEAGSPQQVVPEPVVPEPVIPEPVVPEPMAPAVIAAPTDVRAERDAEDRSVTVTWTPGDEREVEYKISRLTPDGRWQVVGRTRSTTIVDGAVTADDGVPVYGVVARLGPALSDVTRSPEAPAADPSGIPAVRHLTLTAPGVLGFVWPPGVTEAMVVVRRDARPEGPGDPAATTWKITNMRYQLDGGLRLPPSVEPPCHVAVASCRRDGSSLVVAPGFGPTARIRIER